MKSVLDRVPRHIKPLAEGLTQTRYARFLSAPEGKVHTVFDRVAERIQKTGESWKKNRYFEGDAND